MKHINNYFAVIMLIVISRVFPHPPNFTPLIALSFYVPAILGRKLVICYILAYILIDILFGFHEASFFVWGSIICISLLSKYFKDSLKTRLLGAITGSIIFFILTNFGVWTSGYYGYSLNGLISCYLAAIPFFNSTLIATVIYVFIIEMIIKLFFPNFFIIKNKF